MNSALREDLLSRILEASPTFFERLIIDLMLAMGYGGQGSSRHLGKTGDGGVDGVIYQDKLGLDPIFLQAKRYAPGNTVSSETILAFVGALDGQNADKGVFVTTSAFSNDKRLFKGGKGARGEEPEVPDANRRRRVDSPAGRLRRRSTAPRYNQVEEARRGLLLRYPVKSYSIPHVSPNCTA